MKVRLYRDDGSTNPDIDMKHMKQQVHAMFCQWVKSSYHVRDFLEALEHQATSMYSTYRISNSPEIPADVLLSDEATLLSLEPFLDEPTTADGLKPRFFTAEGHLNGAIGLEEEFRAVLAQLFAHWVRRDYHARDFIQALKDCGVGTYYSYMTVKSFNGMGGGKTLDEFLNTRPA